MTFCQNCGAQAEPGAPACPRCGKPSGPAQTVAPYQQQPAYYPYPYPVYQPPAQPVQPGANTFAILGFVTAWLPIPFAWLVLSIIGLVQCGRTGQRGRGLAIAGIVLRTLIALLVIVGIVLAAVYGAEAGGYSPEDWGWDDGFAFTVLGLR